MDIVFVNPPLTLKERFGKFAVAGNIMPPLGLCYLAAACRAHGLKTEIIDAPAERLDTTKVKERILQTRPRFVGLTATTLSILNASEVAEAIKREAGDILTVIGGPHLSSVPERTMERYPFLDFGVIGEGESTIIELIDSIQGSRNIEGVNGIIYHSPGGLRRTEIREKIKDLDVLPLPAWDMLPNYPHTYKPLEIAMSDRLQGSIITSRGCPYECSYCPKSVFGRVVRYHSIDRSMEMILNQYHQYHVRDLEIYDDTLILSQERIRQLCRRLIAEKLDLTWSCNSTIGSVNRATLELMKEAGCWKIGFGIESANPEILKLMNEQLNLHKAREVLRTSREAGLVNRGYFIIGFPTETKESIRNTVNFAKEADLDIVQFNSFTPLPGSAVCDDINRYGTFDDDWDKMNFINSVFIPNGFDREGLKKAIDRAYREFYLRPRIVISFLKRIKNVRLLFSLLKNFFSFIRIFYAGAFKTGEDAH